MNELQPEKHYLGLLDDADIFFRGFFHKVYYSVIEKPDAHQIIMELVDAYNNSDGEKLSEFRELYM